MSYNFFLFPELIKIFSAWFSYHGNLWTKILKNMFWVQYTFSPCVFKIVLSLLIILWDIIQYFNFSWLVEWHFYSDYKCGKKQDGVYCSKNNCYALSSSLIMNIIINIDKFFIFSKTIMFVFYFICLKLIYNNLYVDLWLIWVLFFDCSWRVRFCSSCKKSVRFDIFFLMWLITA